jgi:hypothetical protein
MKLCSSFLVFNLFFLCLGKHSGHECCKKFQLFLYEEFSRMFKMYTTMVEKETATNEKLLQALEKCDELEIEVESLRDQLAEVELLDFDL